MMIYKLITSNVTSFFSKIKITLKDNNINKKNEFSRSFCWR